jgi:hypothetical protein
MYIKTLGVLLHLADGVAMTITDLSNRTAAPLSI